jgi:hypothetical protein
MEAHEIQALTGDFPPIFVSRPNFVISQLQNEHTNFGTKKEALQNFSLLYAGQMRLCEGQKDLLEFHRKFLQPPTPMAGDCGNARLSAGGSGGETGRKRRVGAALIYLLDFVCRFRHFVSPPTVSLALFQDLSSLQLNSRNQ